MMYTDETDEYAEFLATRGVSLETLGLRELALHRDDALCAIDLLRTARVRILGGDVYFATDDGIDVAYANWHTDKVADESFDRLMHRSWEESRLYIERFPKSQEAVPLFVLVVAPQDPHPG